MTRNLCRNTSSFPKSCIFIRFYHTLENATKTKRDKVYIVPI